MIAAFAAYVQTQDSGCHDLVKVKTLNDCVQGLSLAVFEIDGCEYIGPRTFGIEGIRFLTHKGNCRFCEAKRSSGSNGNKTFSPESSPYYNRYSR